MAPRRGPGKRGTGRVQTQQRANTVARKFDALVGPWGDKDKEELLGIAQGIMCDRSVNYMEAPYWHVAEHHLTGDKKEKFNKSAKKLKHQYHIEEHPPSANYDKRKYKPPKGKRYTED